MGTGPLSGSSPSWVMGTKRMRRDGWACPGSPHCPQHQPSRQLLHTLCPTLSLTSAGGHVHTLLILANGPRFTGCPGDEVYNRTICPPAMTRSRGDLPRAQPPLYAAMKAAEMGAGKGPSPGAQWLQAESECTELRAAGDSKTWCLQVRPSPPWALIL